MSWTLRVICTLAVLMLAGPAVADNAAAPGTPGDLHYRERVAAADIRLTSEWMAKCYEIPKRVPLEMLIDGHDYADVMVALAMMAKGCSLNELLFQRQTHRWEPVARIVELDPQTLPQPIRDLLPFGRNDPPAPLLHFLPDVYTGLIRDLTINFFPPTEPSQTSVRAFKLNDQEVADIRTALADPFGVPEEFLLRPAGRGLQTGDWVLAGVLAHLKPFGMDNILFARVGDRAATLSWQELCLAFGLRADVLTRGPLTAIYPVLTGYAPGTILVARKRTKFPDSMPLLYDLVRLTPTEERALIPLMVRAYSINNVELQQLQASNYELAEQGIAVALARMAHLDVATILRNRQSGDSWSDVVRRYAIDMTGQEGVSAAIAVREGLGVQGEIR